MLLKAKVSGKVRTDVFTFARIEMTPSKMQARKLA